MTIFRQFNKSYISTTSLTSHIIEWQYWYIGFYLIWAIVITKCVQDIRFLLQNKLNYYLFYKQLIVWCKYKSSRYKVLTCLMPHRPLIADTDFASFFFFFIRKSEIPHRFLRHFSPVDYYECSYNNFLCVTFSLGHIFIFLISYTYIKH